MDYSSNHMKELEDGLLASKIGLKWGGKQSAKRASRMTEGCRGPDPPRIYGKVLAINSIQSMIFKEGDDPSFLDPSAVDHVGKNTGNFSIYISLPCEL